MNKCFLLGDNGASAIYGESMDLDTEKMEDTITIFNCEGETITLDEKEIQELFKVLQDIILDKGL